MEQAPGETPCHCGQVLLYSYENQYAWARWGKARSERFRIQNVTIQGSIFSPNACCTYTDPLLQRLRALGVGCHLAGLFMSAFLYNGDQLLIAPSRRAVELMLKGVESFAKESNVHFSTDPNPAKSKSKMIYVCGRAIGLDKPVPLLLSPGSPRQPTSAMSFTSLERCARTQSSNALS